MAIVPSETNLKSESKCKYFLSRKCFGKFLPARGFVGMKTHSVFPMAGLTAWCSNDISSRPQCVNTMRPRQNGRHIPDDIFKCIFLNENVWILLKISRKFVPKFPINNIPALFLIMAWCRPGDKPLSEPMMVSLPTHICVTRPQWVNKTVLLLTTHLSNLLIGLLDVFCGSDYGVCYSVNVFILQTRNNSLGLIWSHTKWESNGTLH